MLGKLIKYEWKATSRQCLPIYLAVLIVAVVNRLMPGLNSIGAQVGFMRDTLPVITHMLYFGLLVAAFVVTFVVLIRRFYSSLLGDEGYLMFTLPVTVGRHIWAKSIVAVIYSLICGFVTFLSILILARVSFFELMQGAFEVFKIMGHQPSSFFYVFEFLLICMIGMVASILFVYLCIAIGHLAKKHRVAVAFMAYFAISTGLQILGVSAINVIDSTGMLRWMGGMSEEVLVQIFIWGIILVQVVTGAVCFLGTNYILKNKLNLE